MHHDSPYWDYEYVYPDGDRLDIGPQPRVRPDFTWKDRFSDDWQPGEPVCVVRDCLVIEVDPDRGGDEQLKKLEQKYKTCYDDYYVQLLDGKKHLFFHRPVGVDIIGGVIAEGLRVMADNEVWAPTPNCKPGISPGFTEYNLPDGRFQYHERLEEPPDCLLPSAFVRRPTRLGPVIRQDERRQLLAFRIMQARHGSPLRWDESDYWNEYDDDYHKDFESRLRCMVAVTNISTCDPPLPECELEYLLKRENEAHCRAWAEDFWSSTDENTDPLAPVGIDRLAKLHPQLKQPLIDGILRIGETANIIAPTKRGKSWLVYGLALSIATGRPWLGEFQTQQGRALVIDNELHPETIADRIPTVAAAMGIDMAELADRVEVISLRGRLMNYHGLAERLGKLIKPGRYQAVIVDAHYRMLPPDTSENENTAITNVYNLIDQFTGHTEAAWILIHHSTKGNQGEKSVTDVGAGAGAQSRAPDTHIVLRDHENDDCVVLDAAARSWPPVVPLVLQWKFPTWTPVEGVDPEELKGRRTPREARQARADGAAHQEILQALQKNGPLTMKKLQRAVGMGKERMDRLLCQLTASKAVTCTEAMIQKKPRDVYALARAA